MRRKRTRSQRWPRSSSKKKDSRFWRMMSPRRSLQSPTWKSRALMSSRIHLSTRIVLRRLKIMGYKMSQFQCKNHCATTLSGSSAPSGSIQPWLMSADEGSQSDTIKPQQPSEERTMPKPRVLMENRGPLGIAEAAVAITLPASNRVSDV